MGRRVEVLSQPVFIMPTMPTLASSFARLGEFAIQAEQMCRLASSECTHWFEFSGVTCCIACPKPLGEKALGRSEGLKAGLYRKL